jgi:ligand-binding sensor domain-containing protein
VWGGEHRTFWQGNATKFDPNAGTWLVATEEGLWRTSEAGVSTLVARFPDVLSNPDSLARAADGTLYVGARNGVLRLTPLWPETPRYLPDWLVTGADDRSCRHGE